MISAGRANIIICCGWPLIEEGLRGPGLVQLPELALAYASMAEIIDKEHAVDPGPEEIRRAHITDGMT